MIETKMIEPVKVKNYYKPDCGDILSGNQFIAKKVSDDETFENVIPLTVISNNPWRALNELGIKSGTLKRTFQYECPYIKNTYFHFVPIALIIKGTIEPYEKHMKETLSYSKDKIEYVFDFAWTKKMYGEDLLEPTCIQRSMLGHGYTSGTLPMDGSGKFIKVLIKLDNDDFLFGYCWEWYNK